MSEQIGLVSRVRGGYFARCALCSWERTERTAEEATKILKGHASLMHPVPIKVYR